jgi:hypothetical protein
MRGRYVFLRRHTQDELQRTAHRARTVGAAVSRCTGCERHIAGTATDPVHAITGGVFCLTCFRARLSVPTPQPQERKPSTGRADAARARWAAMTPEQKAERVKKMQAGRLP